MNNIYNNWPLWIQQEILQRLKIQNWTQINLLKNSKKKYLNKIINEYNKGIPLTKIIGIKYFYDYKLINKNVLDPRYDSEVIIDVLDYLININYRPETILELGGGSGCLSIAAYKKFFNKVIIGELNEHSIKTLQRNLKINNVNGEIIKTNWWSNINNQYNILITNPPYLSLEDMINGNYQDTYGDPMMALYGGIDGLYDYRCILKSVKFFINGWIILEICHNKLEKIKKIIMDNNLWIEKVFYDLNNKSRIILIKIKK